MAAAAAGAAPRGGAGPGAGRPGRPRGREAGGGPPLAPEPGGARPGRSHARPLLGTPPPHAPRGSLGRLGRERRGEDPGRGASPCYPIRTLAERIYPAGEGVLSPAPALAAEKALRTLGGRLAGQVSEQEGTGDAGTALAREGRSLCVEPRPALG